MINFINPFKLLTKKRFLPLFLTQFLGAFNDNAFKNALAVLITYRISTAAGMDSSMLVTLATGLFIAPYLLFSALAGQIADKYEKSRLIRITKFAEILLMLIATIGFFTDNLFLLMSVLFLLGTQATFFGPLKYAILPQNLHSNELISGNSFIEAGTFIAILLGSILGGLLILTQAGDIIISLLILLVALGGWYSSCFVPDAPAGSENEKIHYNIFAQTWKVIRHSSKSPSLFLSVIGISWFWLIGATLLTQLPLFTKNIVGAEESVFTLFLSLFSIGIAIGSILYNVLSKGKLALKLVYLAALGMSLFMIDLFFTSQKIVLTNTDTLITLQQFLISPHGWHISLDLFLLSVCGGIYTVPLYALLQIASEPQYRARAIASNNIMNALFMVIATGFAMGMFALNFSVIEIFLALAIANVGFAFCLKKFLRYQT